MSQEKQLSAETTSPVSSSHEIAREPLCTAERLAQERRQFVVDKAAREAKRFAQDLETMAAGNKAAEYLVDGSPADMIPEEVVPLLDGAVVAVDEPIDETRSILEQRIVTLCRRRDDGLTDDEFCQAVADAYQQSPAMRRVQEVAHQITSGIEHLHAGDPMISIDTFDPSIYIDRVLMRRVQQDGGYNAMGRHCLPATKSKMMRTSIYISTPHQRERCWMPVMLVVCSLRMLLSGSSLPSRVAVMAMLMPGCLARLSRWRLTKRATLWRKTNIMQCSSQPVSQRRIS